MDRCLQKGYQGGTCLTTQSTRPNFVAKGRSAQAQGPTQTLKVQKVFPAEMAERRKQGLCYYCDEK